MKSIKEEELALLEKRPLFDIEASPHCNISCPFCPREKLDALGKRMMDLDMMRRVSAWVPSGSSVILSGLGEPLLNRDIPQFIRMLREKGCDVAMITNGILLTPALADELKEAGLEEVQVSLHTLDREKYRQVTGNDIGIVLGNLAHLRGMVSGTFRVRLNSVLDLQGEERAEFICYAEENSFTPFIRKLHSRGGSVYSPKVEAKGCGPFASMTFIASDGAVKTCSNNYFGENLGSIFDDSFDDIREKKRRIISEGKSFEACGKCDDEYRWVVLETEDVHAIHRSV